MKKYILYFLSCFVFGTSLYAQPNGEPPKLVVEIVIDQMRQDYLYRFWDLYGDDGFKRIVGAGFNFANTHYNYFPTYTAAGHACIGTGAVPSVHGIVGNDWIENETGKRMYCSRDWSVQGVGTDTDAGKMSPRNMKATTFGDEMRLASNFQSKVFGVSMKDRGAIMTSGHFAKAFWFHETESNFITSTYYMDELPQWVKDFNAQNLTDSFLNETWDTSVPTEILDKYTEKDNSRFEGKFRGKSEPVFPYNLKELRKENNNKLILSTPYGNTIALEFAKALIQNEKLGSFETGYPNVLTLSLSSTDYIGHLFGIRSMEVADTYIRLDKELGDFLNFLDTQTGEGQYVLVLSADHGGADNTGFLTSNGYEANRFQGSLVEKDLKEYLKNKYGEDLMTGYINLQIYLNEKRIDSLGLSKKDIVEDIEQFLRFKPGVHKVFSSESVSKGLVSDDILKMYMNGYYSSRSGDVFIMLKSGWMDMYWQETGTTHGSVFSYDTHVPLLFYGKNIPKGTVYDRTTPAQIASTLSALIGISPPSGCVSEPLIKYFGKSITD